MSRHRSVLTALATGLIGALLTVSAPLAFGQTPGPAPDVDCNALPPHLKHVADEWARPAQKIAILSRPEGSSPVSTGTKVRFTLLPWEKVKLAMEEPEEKTVKFAGLLTFRSGKAGAYRVSTTPYVWLELVPMDASAPAAGVTGSDRRLNFCVGMEKNVVFDLAADTSYWLQVSGTPHSDIQLLITAPQ